MSEFNFPCPACGHDILCDSAHAGTDITCPACQAPIAVPKETAEAAAVPAPTDTPPPFTGYHAVPAEPRNSKLAIASLVCSLASLVTCIGWLPGIICGHLAKSRICRDPTLQGNGLATAGLTLGYLLLIVEVGIAAVKIAAFTSAMKLGIENAKLQLATNAIVVTQPHSQTIANASPMAEVAAGWTTNLDRMSFPNQPVRGKLHGLDFVLKSATLRTVNLKLNADNGLALEILGLGKSPEGRSYEISSTDAGANPRVRMTWSDGAAVQTVMFNRGYSLKLQFGQSVNRKGAGKIFVCLPDDAQSYLAGTFEVRGPKPK